MIETPQSVAPLVEAAFALAESLRDDPFYKAITAGIESEPAAGKKILRRYF